MATTRAGYTGLVLHQLRPGRRSGGNVESVGDSVRTLGGQSPHPAKLGSVVRAV